MGFHLIIQMKRKICDPSSPVYVGGNNEHFKDDTVGRFGEENN